MTYKNILIMLVAGATSVALMAAGFLGSLLALPFFMLSPLPIAIVSLGWGSYVGFGAAIVGALGVMTLTSLLTGMLYAAAFGLPIAYLSHAAGLSRQDDPQQAIEWFPVGEVLFRGVVIGGTVIGLSFVFTNFDILETSKVALGLFEEAMSQLDAATRRAMEQAIALQIRLIPYTMPTVWLLTMGLNLWLGVKIARQSGRFQRPSFSLRDAELPWLIVPVFGVGLVISFMSPPLAHLGAAFVGIIVMAFILIGCNTVHVVTSRLAMRGAILALLYLSIVFFGVPLLIMAGLGLADFSFKIRQRFRLANP